MLPTEVKRLMTFEQFKTSLLMSLGTILVAIAGFMATSIWQLNEKMAVVVEKLTFHAELLRRHDEEIRMLRVQSKPRGPYNGESQTERHQ